ncbi:hypothetical protein PIROE2DRAFT_5951 [Piromyces sp. E2]|nr:hypothetical protein PIROE2DRAFT_5951 [Piromyces sp. E2]|eukprot:OUM66742.1 hypothetical protein PIROE2DRAFT_5951 [Piromyces sp. E2]
MIFLPQIKEQWNLFQTSPKNRIGYYLPIPFLPSYISNIKIQGVWLLVIANIVTQFVFAGVVWYVKASDVLKKKEKEKAKENIKKKN